jgi:hypothetical protein
MIQDFFTPFLAVSEKKKTKKYIEKGGIHNLHHLLTFQSGLALLSAQLGSIFLHTET